VYNGAAPSPPRFLWRRGLGRGGWVIKRYLLSLTLSSIKSMEEREPLSVEIKKVTT
jgi:hypothetical protein